MLCLSDKPLALSMTIAPLMVYSLAIRSVFQDGQHQSIPLAQDPLLHCVLDNMAAKGGHTFFLLMGLQPRCGVVAGMILWICG